MEKIFGCSSSSSLLSLYPINSILLLIIFILLRFSPFFYFFFNPNKINATIIHHFFSFFLYFFGFCPPTLSGVSSFLISPRSSSSSKLYFVGTRSSWVIFSFGPSSQLDCCARHHNSLETCFTSIFFSIELLNHIIGW